MPKFETNEKILDAQDLINCHYPSVNAGFNTFIQGYTYSDLMDRYDFSEASQGFNKAEEMANAGAISFRKLFNCKCGGGTHLYGGFIKCFKCDGDSSKVEWFNIRVEKDGNEFCCHGMSFENLQESENYAFGSTFQKAINNYEDQMRSINGYSKLDRK